MLFEKLISEFRIFGESLSDVRDRVGRMEPDLHQVKEDVTLLKSVARSHSEELRTIKSDVGTLKSDVSTLKSDVSTLKSDVSTLKLDVAEIKDDFKNNNLRLEVVEAKLAS